VERTVFLYLPVKKRLKETTIDTFVQMVTLNFRTVPDGDIITTLIKGDYELNRKNKMNEGVNRPPSHNSHIISFDPSSFVAYSDSSRAKPSKIQ
jgi:hypothetical protein